MTINDKSLLSQITTEVADEVETLINLLNNFEFKKWGSWRSQNFSHYLALRIRSQLTLLKYVYLRTDIVDGCLVGALEASHDNLEKSEAMLREFMWLRNGIDGAIEFSQFITEVLTRECFVIRSIAEQIDANGEEQIEPREEELS